MPKPLRFRVVLWALTPLILLLAVSASSSSAAVAYSSHLRRYPYLTDVVSSFATINWGTDQFLSTGAVRYGVVGSESCTAHYAPATRNPIKVNTVPEYQWSAMLDLAPGTQYCYRVYQGSSPSTEIDLLGSDPSPSFSTQVPAGSAQPYSFAVFGDWGYVGSTGANPYQARLMSLIANSGARFAITVGDNAYPAGNQTNYGDLVQVGSNMSAVFGPQFWKVAGSSMPIFPASGNHGMSAPDALHPMLLNFPQTRAVALSGGRYIKQTYCCLDGTTSASYPSAWYAFDAGLARMYVLDVSWSETNVGTASSPYQVDHDYHWTPTSPEYQWLQADLASHASALKFAFWHYPLYSDDPDNPSDTYLQGSGALEGLLKKYGVQLIFAGHSHTYQRFYASPAGLPSYVSGGGGAQPTTLGTCTALDAYAIKFTTYGRACGTAPVPTSIAQFYHFILVSVNGTHVAVAPTDSLGQTFDVQNFDLSAGSESNPPSVPSNLAVSVVSGTRIDLTWSSSTDDTGVRGYDVYRNGALISTTGAGTPGYSDAALVPGTTYSYTVDAFDAYGNHSPASPPVSATTATTAIYTFTPVADAYVDGNSPTANFGLASALLVGASPDRHAYLRFNVADIGGSVTKATLRLYAATSSSVGYQVQAVLGNAWDENQVIYASAPALGGLIGASVPFSSGNWVDVDVTSLVTRSGSYDLAVTTTDTTPLTFNSRDAASNAPQLIVQTDAPLPTPTATPTATPTPTPTPSIEPPPGLPGAILMSGNVGVANATLTYTDGTVKSITADGNGNYSIKLPYGWSGALRPYKAGYAFTPSYRSYKRLTADAAGQSFTPHPIYASFYRSTGAYDGWILESGQNSKVGGTIDAADTTLRLGDDASRSRYLSILSFDTSGLPDNAVIVWATFTLTKQAVVPIGIDPLSMFQGLVFGIRHGYYGLGNSLEPYDFQALGNAGGFSPSRLTIAGPVYRIDLPPAALPYINKTTANGGLTQFRVRFKLPDNNDFVADYISFFSGDALTYTDRPALVVGYYVP